jgi:hypothetical protein
VYFPPALDHLIALIRKKPTQLQTNCSLLLQAALAHAAKTRQLPADPWFLLFDTVFVSLVKIKNNI